MNCQQIHERTAVTIARHNINSGFYDWPAVIEETIRRVHQSLLDEQVQREADEQAAFDMQNDGERFDGQG